MSARTRAIATLIFIMLLWGTAAAITKSMLPQLPPLTLAFVRFLVAAAALTTVALAVPSARHALPRLPWGRMILMGAAGITLFYAGLNGGLALTSVSNSSLIQGAIPAFTAILAWLWLGERSGGRRSLGIVVSVAGVAILVLGGNGANGGSLIGDLLVVGAAAAWAVYTVLGRNATTYGSQLAVSAASTLCGTVLLLPLSGVELALVGWPGAPTPWAWAGVVYLGLVVSALPFFLWNRALSALDASETATYVNLIPLIGVLTAVLGLGERLGLGQIFGGVLILVGVYLASRPRTRPAGRAPVPMAEPTLDVRS